MRRLTKLLCFIGCLFLGLVGPALVVTASAEQNARKPEYILFLTADGFRSEYLEWYAPPVLKRLAAEGVRVRRVDNVFPTLTTPNMTALVTGAYPRTSGIAANTQYVAEQDRIVKSPRDNRAETIAETLKKAGFRTAAINYFMLQGRGADLYLAPGYDNSAATTQAILAVLKTNGAHFIAAIYGETDHAGHSHGPHSKAVQDAVLSIDAAIGKLMQGLKDLGIYERTLITFNSDHGMSAYESKNVSVEPAEALRKAGFQVATSQQTLTKNSEVIVLDAGVRLIYFRPGVRPDARERAAEVLAAIRGVEVLGRPRLDSLGCHNNRSGDLIVSPLPGYTINGAGRSGGLHGRFSESNPVLFFWGPGLKAGERVTQARMIDIVPTLLRLVDVPPAKTVDGTALSLQ